MPCRSSAAAVRRSIPSGTGTAVSARTVTTLAYEPEAPDAHATRPPTASSVTPGPIARTDPAPSPPTTCGNGTAPGTTRRRSQTLSVAADTTSDKNAQYAHPERLVTTQWLADHLGTPGLVVVESDEDVLLYETGHIPGAVKIDWHTDLNDPDVRDYVDGARFAELLGSKGIARDTTVVVYGDKGNWWAAYTLWVL